MTIQLIGFLFSSWIVARTLSTVSIMIALTQLVPSIPLVFIFGAAIGSFLNVVILRFGTSLNITHDRSRCPHCSHTLQWFDLIPIISFIFLRGRCRKCHAAISPQYPLVEMFIGIAAVVTVSSFLGGMMSAHIALMNFLIVCVLTILFVIDWNTFLLPDYYVVLLSVLVLLRHYFFFGQSPFEVVMGAFVGAGFIFALWVVTKGRGIGFGDVKLMIPLGFLFGFEGVVALLFLSFISGGAVGTFLLLTRRATPKTAIPFGPYLTGAAILLLLLPFIFTPVMDLFFSF